MFQYFPPFELHNKNCSTLPAYAVLPTASAADASRFQWDVFFRLDIVLFGKYTTSTIPTACLQHTESNDDKNRVELLGRGDYITFEDGRENY